MVQVCLYFLYPPSMYESDAIKSTKVINTSLCSRDYSKQSCMIYTLQLMKKEMFDQKNQKLT